MVRSGGINRRIRRKSTGRMSKVDKKQQLQINKLLKQQYRWAQYKLGYATDDAPINGCAPVITPNLWNPIFAANARSANTDRAFLKKIRFMFNITPSNSGLLTVSPFHYCIFIFSIRREFALQTQQRLTPSFSTLTENQDFIQHTLGATIGSAQWQLNPTMYKVHAIRRGMVGNFANEGLIQAPGTSVEAAAQVSNITDANKNHIVKINHNRRIQRGVGQVGSNQQEWKDMTVNDINAEDQLYVGFFNNAAVDQTVAFHWSAQIMLKVPQ